VTETGGQRRAPVTFLRPRQRGDTIPPVSRYDVIGDIHGRADKLVGLLRKLGYEERQGAWRHSDRTAVFVGDLIDRGPQQRDSIRIPRAMVEAGSAQIVLGNHEFNAIAYSQWNEGRSDFCRSRLGDERGKKNHKQHKAFIEQIGLDTPQSKDALDWFRTIPMWLDLGNLRVVHACWDQASIDHLASVAGPSNTVTEQIIVDGTKGDEEDTGRDHPTHTAIETIIKGPEIYLGGRVYLDKGNHERRYARRKWWDDAATTMRAAAVIPPGTKGVDGKPFPPLPNEDLADADRTTYTDDVPVIVGHYWETGTPTLLGPKAACVDYSAGKGGALVAYQWKDGATELVDANFISF
jgi:hypothetical protein